MSIAVLAARINPLHVWICLLLLDALLTQVATSRGALEVNPLLTLGVRNIGMQGTLLFKSMTGIMVGSILWKLGKSRLFGLLNIALAGVVIFNLAVMTSML